MTDKNLEGLANEQDILATKMFIKATGTIQQFFGSTAVVGKAREQEVGLYDANNGILAVVDEKQDYFVGRCNKKSIAALDNLGFKSGDIYVPHSNGGSLFVYNVFKNLE